MNPIAAGGGFSADALALYRQELLTRQQSPGGLYPMSNPAIPSIGPEGVVPSRTPVVGFDSLLGNFVHEVNTKQVAAGDAVTGLLSGKDVPLHQAMIAMEEASVSFQLMVEVSNKLLEGYQELLRMQV